ncbi:Crp/Fnr family transcriptional regulator [Helicovermis profundi]|uniref:Cyclic nucleotide-binding domain-containing protein n=1 Tax=Helicovermis profundi TaxID=3065157 RepID=A0AAU9EPB0_9FIRM|nr:hypothetical protein HLPR_23000 [Clostridia bacterium S502]
MNNNLKSVGKIVNFELDEHVFYEGEDSKSTYIILSGEVEIYITNDVTNSKIVLAKLGPGGLFGEMSIIDEEERTASVCALSKVIALEIVEENFNEFVTLEPKYAINMMKTLSERINVVKNKIDNLVVENID